MFFTLPMTAVRSLENEVMTMVQGCEAFLDRHTGDVPDSGTDADMSQFLINSADMVSNDLHYLDAGGNGTPSGTSTTETQSIHILGYIYLYKATKNVAFLEKAKRFWQSYFDVFYLGQPIPAAAKEFRCHWMVNAKQPFNAAYPINQEQSSHSGWKGVQLTATGNMIQVPDDQTYFGSQLQKVTFAFRDTDILVWDAINARVTQPDWNDKGHVYEVDWFINYKGQKLNPGGDKVDDTVYPDSEKGKIHLSGRVFEESTDGKLLESNKDFNGMTVKVNFCTANGPVIERNQPFDPRPLWTPLKPGWQGNASDAEQWFGDACFQLWEITGEDKYRIMHECVVLTCKGYCDIDRGQLFWRKDKNASSPYSDGIGYVFSNEDDITDKNALFSRDHTTGFNVLDLSQISGTNKDIVLEQQAVWYKLKPESKLSTEIAATTPLEAVTLSLVSYVLIGTEKTDDEKVGTQTWFRMPNFPNLSPVPAVNDQLISGAYVIDGNSRFADHTDASPYGEDGSIVHSASQHNDMAGYSGESALFEYVPYKKVDDTFPYAGTDGFWYNLANYGAGDKYVVGHNLVFRLWDDEGGLDTNTWEISLTEQLPDGTTKDHDGEITGPQNTWMVQSIAEIVGHEITNPIESFTANPKHVNSMNKRYFEFYCMNAPTKYDPEVHGVYLLRHRLQAKTTAPLEIHVGDCFVKEYAEDNLKYTPGMIPFSNNYNPDTNQYDSWQGMPFMGYQYGWIWKDAPVYWNNSVQALYDAQQAYVKDWDDGTPVFGPICAGFVWNRWDNVGYGPINTFVNTVWGNQRPWDGYQARAVLSVGRIYEQMIKDGKTDERVTEMCNAWVNFLYEFQKKNDGKFPDYFPKDTPDDGDPNYPINKWDFVGHIVGNYLSAVCKMAMAGLENENTWELIEALYQDIKKNYYIGAAKFHMNGCWSESPSTGQFFGFWAGDIYKALAHYLMFEKFKQSAIKPAAGTGKVVPPERNPDTGGTGDKGTDPKGDFDTYTITPQIGGYASRQGEIGYVNRSGESNVDGMGIVKERGWGSNEPDELSEFRALIKNPMTGNEITTESEAALTVQSRYKQKWNGKDEITISGEGLSTVIGREKEQREEFSEYRRYVSGSTFLEWTNMMKAKAAANESFEVKIDTEGKLFDVFKYTVDDLDKRVYTAHVNKKGSIYADPPSYYGADYFSWISPKLWFDGKTLIERLGWASNGSSVGFSAAASESPKWDGHTYIEITSENMKSIMMYTRWFGGSSRGAYKVGRYGDDPSAWKNYLESKAGQDIEITFKKVNPTIDSLREGYAFITSLDSGAFYGYSKASDNGRHMYNTQFGSGTELYDRFGVMNDGSAFVISSVGGKSWDKYESVKVSIGDLHIVIGWNDQTSRYDKYVSGNNVQEFLALFKATNKNYISYQISGFGARSVSD